MLRCFAKPTSRWSGVLFRRENAKYFRLRIVAAELSSTFPEKIEGCNPYDDLCAEGRGRGLRGEGERDLQPNAGDGDAN